MNKVEQWWCCSMAVILVVFLTADGTLVVLLMGNCTGEDKKANDKDKLQGTWVVAETEFEGKIHPGNGLRFVFQGDRVSMRGKRAGETIEGWKFRLVPDKKPNALDLTLNENGKTLGQLGIYELDRATLRNGWAPRTKPSPRPAGGPIAALSPLRRTRTSTFHTIGKVEVDLVGDCKIPFAPDHIKKFAARRAIGKKRQSPKC